MTDSEKFKSYKPQHSTEEVILLTGKVLKSPVANIGRIDYGEINAVYYHNRNSQGGLKYVQEKITAIEKSLDNL